MALVFTGAVQPAGAAPSETAVTADLSATSIYNIWLYNVNSKKCALVQGDANENPAVQFQCLDYADQYWRLHYYGGVNNGVYWIQNENSKQCLIVRGTADHTRLVQFTCMSYLDQGWQMVIRF